jgi:predicted dehydrogenase
MPNLSRRQFLGTSLAAAGTIAISHTKSSGKILGANDTIRVGVAGLNGRGGSHVGAYLGMENVEIVALIDPDKRTYKKHLDSIDKKGGGKPECLTDIRKALESKNLDAVSIATPNHWHSLMTIWACQAGKDVYVEKPMSHNVHEGRVAVEAARRHNRIVQHGTQSRADGKWARLAEIVKSGKLGKLLVSYGLCYKPRNSIGTKPVAAAPKEVDFDLWLGPAKEQPHHGNLVHYNWHWFWDFGNGDIGNQGVHQMDIARWGIPGATLPRSVVSFGGRFGYQDQGQTPNTQVALFTFPDTDTKMIFEVRGLKTGTFHGQGIGNVLKFDSGIVAGNRFFPTGKEQGEPLPDVKMPQRGPGDNFANFIHAVRTRKRDQQHADILEGHYSSALGHLANVAYRLGTDAPFLSGVKSALKDEATADATERMMAHLVKDNGLKLEDLTLRSGGVVKFDPKAEKCIDSPEGDKLLTRAYRKPFQFGERA